jgi:tRNA-dihydrouridine synthase
MVGRGAQGAPWRLAEIARALFGAPAPQVPQGTARADLVAAHYEAMLGFYGRDLGLRIARKHLGWYAGEAGVDPGQRARLMVATDPDEVVSLIGHAFTEPRFSEAA